MDILLRYFDDCPNWRDADRTLRAALDAVGRTDVAVRYEEVTTQEDAERLGFTGSPTILIDGLDPFAQPDAVAGLACRVYSTPEGLRGSPTVEQISAALA